MSKYDYENEKEIVVKKKGGLAGKLLAVFLGFLLGIVGCLGGIVGGGYYIAKKKTAKDILSLADIDYSEYLTEEYATKTIWDMIGSTVSTLGAFVNGEGTFGDLAAISPAVENMVTEFADSAKQAYGVDINKDGALMNVPFSQINYHISSCLMETEAGVMFASFGSGNKVLTALCYGVEGEDYVVENDEIKMLDGKKAMTVGDFAGAGLKERMDALPLDTLMTVDPADKTTCAIVYGEEHHYTVNQDDSVTMNQMQYTLVETTEGVTLYDDHNELVECTLLEISENVYKATFKDESVCYLSKTKYVEPVTETPETEKPEAEAQAVLIEGGNTFYVYNEEQCKTPVRYKKTTVGDLEGDAASVINKIALKDALNVTHNSHGVLIALAYGEEKIDFDFTYDSETGAKTGIKEYGAPRTIGDFRGNSQAMIDDIYLTSVISPKQDNKIIMYLLYGRQGVHYDIVDGTPDMLQKQVAITSNGLVYNEYGELIANASSADGGQTYAQYDTDGTTKLASYKLSAIANVEPLTVTLPLEDGQTEAKTASAPLYYVFDESGENKIEYTRTQMRDLTGDSKLLSNFTTRLTLSDVLDVGDNKILKHLTDVTIAGLPKAINELTVGQVFYEDMHYTDGNGNFTQADGQTPLGENEQPILRPTWKYLLKTRPSTEEPTPYYNYDYRVTTDMNIMVENIEYNMQNTPLNEMNEDKVIVTHENLRTIKLKQAIVADAETLYPNTFANISFADGQEPTLGDLTVQQALVYLEIYILEDELADAA